MAQKGTTIDLEGTVTLSVHIASETVPTKFLVTADLQETAMLGQSWLASQNAIDCSQGCIYLRTTMHWLAAWKQLSNPEEITVQQLEAKLDRAEFAMRQQNNH
ncbi:hypothetical protein PR048_002971 [Dryococelus australis]|uniref:Uncharacterized protein n=1 Tax=Dryococelus australis TaxID=614101 RepID=A0ABQ9IM92_9NEOP|nr:hypothetical protein PR048_002971 [Dryococelus australis]